MNSLIWLWLYSLLSRACNVDHAIWRPDYGMTVLSDLIPALPQVTVEKFKTLNGGINPNDIGTNVSYKVPYSSEMEIIKPAKWSGNCPKTLLLLGEETTQNTPTSSRQTAASTLTQRTTNPSVTASGTTTDHTATTTTSTQRAGSPANSKPTTQATDTTRTETPTAVKGDSKKATGSAGGESTKTATASGEVAKLPNCWPRENMFYLKPSVASKAIRETAVNDFCKEFRKKPLTTNYRSNDLKRKDLALFAYLHQGCKSNIDEAVCLKYFKAIETECDGHGGLLGEGCALVWIQKFDAV